ncbi:polysaccharide pyruvyl transferase family protein [Nakamurella deserti]|uniref:polysaccharide pyruvyl transferase family protein n=1 Tax=Nakamurella deserti TaxID=2164074 RepID=UPI000DBE403B|nr:polysaccharide pyruvyl transferase family protein [Nakamurella deserti]
MRVVILNVYSARNRGDGLLAELAVAMGRDAYGADTTFTVAAHDPASFDDTDFGSPVTVLSPFGSAHGALVAIRGAIALITGGRLGFSRRFRAATRDADVLVSVGGAYLRGGFASELVKCLLVHGSQLAHASRLAKRTGWVLLPQSIGPFTGVAHTLVSRWLARAGAVFLRDDKSVREFAGLTNTHRVGDSAVLAIGATGGATGRGADGAGTRTPVRRGLILRALPDAGEYEDNARALLAASDWVPIVQSARGGNNDVLFYRRLGVAAELSLLDAVRDAGIGVCTSVRLHGALESILLGVPAVHLSYERKGFAAYGDLGLPAYVFDARTADPADVLAAVAALESDPAAFWNALKTTADERVQQRALVVGTLAAAGRPA